MKLLKKKLLSFLLMLSVSCGALFVTNTDVRAAAPETTMAVHFIDVGQGLAVLVQSAGQNLLYDGGDQSHAGQVVSYLQQQNVQNLDYLISSHYDEDHLGGLVDCISTFSVSHVFGSDYIHDSDLFRTFMNTATGNAITVEYPAVGDTFDFGTGSFTVLAPNGISQNSNDNSVVIKLENGSTSFIFTGDAEETSEQDMISTGRNLDCDVLCIGHHGSASSTTWDFLEASSPAYAVISCGTDNQYHHPSAETMGRLSDMGIPVFRTDKQGTITAVSDGTSLSWTQSPCNDYSSGDSADLNTLPDNASEPVALQEASIAEEQPKTYMVWLSATGTKYHNKPNCGNMNPDNARQVTESDAIAQGYEPCKKCF